MAALSYPHCIFESKCEEDIMLPIERDIATQIRNDQSWILNYVAGHERGIVDYTGRMWYQHPDHMHARHAFNRGYRS